MDTKGKLLVPARKRDVFMAAEVENKKKRHPRKDVSVKLLSISGLLIKRSSNVNRTSNSTTNHWVVTDAEESHHLNCAGTDDEPANCASECIRPIVSVILWVIVAH